MNVTGPERLLPVLGTALSSVPKLPRARSHPLSKFPGETAQRILLYAECDKPLKSKRHAEPCIGERACRVGGRGNEPAGTQHELAPCLAVINAHYDVGRSIGIRPRTK